MPQHYESESPTVSIVAARQPVTAAQVADKLGITINRASALLSYHVSTGRLLKAKQRGNLTRYTLNQHYRPARNTFKNPPAALQASVIDNFLARPAIPNNKPASYYG